MVLLCDRCLKERKQKFGGNNVGNMWDANEEDLCEEHYDIWLKEKQGDKK